MVLSTSLTGYEIRTRKAPQLLVNQMKKRIRKQIRLESLPRVESYRITGCTLPQKQTGRFQQRTAYMISQIAMPTIAAWEANEAMITMTPSVTQRVSWQRPEATTLTFRWVMKMSPWSFRWVLPLSESRTWGTRNHRLRTLGSRMDCNYQVLLRD